ncbi:spore germination protein [Aquibacillus sp. 3ASR75-11]|uniref:Spore germination protein n=1 Tax=Terrihalobacillus insolitus TaxID=2950438 RepID=A0A9X4ANX6_9BACI|nr:spore germination protein [Terrihalobacillus insolitus]MDC3413392.1 spore germination protein [Terrihalobacillus insolitus]MDC3424975.1 spore germination protein [Terrihalobacillus insolitus]
METDKKKLTNNYSSNVAYMRDRLAVDKSFDVIQMDLEYAGKKMALFMIDGFIKDDILHLLMKFLAKLEPAHLDPNPLERLMKTYIPYVELDQVEDMNAATDTVLAGAAALLVEGMDKIIMIDARTYPARGPEEPDLERVTRGSRDGYVETIVFNTALTRRRIRDRSLRMEYLSVGRRSKTDIVLCYLEDVADTEKVNHLKHTLKQIDTDGLPMAEKTVEEFLGGRHWNPYPTVRYTERPDTAAAHVFEGHVLIMIDGSPSVMITPATYWHHLQHAEEYRQKPLVGAYLRIVRYIAVLTSIFILPLYYLFSVNQGLVPDGLQFIGPKETGTIPLLAMFLIAEIGIDMLRMAAIHTPSSLATALGLVAAVLIGQVAIEVGLFTNEVVLYLSIAAIGTFATPSYELSLANRISRIALLIVTAIFGVEGYVAGITLWILLLMKTQSFGTAYLWPFMPFSFKSFIAVFVRRPVPLNNQRPVFLDPEDPDR